MLWVRRDVLGFVSQHLVGDGRLEAGARARGAARHFRFGRHELHDAHGRPGGEGGQADQGAASRPGFARCVEGWAKEMNQAVSYRRTQRSVELDERSLSLRSSATSGEKWVG